MKTFTFYSRYIIVLCLLFFATSKIFGQRHFATSQNNAPTGLLCIGCSVTNPLNAVDGNLQSYSVLNVPVGLLAGIYQELNFPAQAPAGTPLTIKLGTGDNLLDVTLLGGVTITPYNGNVAGASVTAPTLASVASSNNQLELIYSPTTPYTKIRVTLSGGLLGALSSIYVYDAFYTTPGGPAICNTPYDELHGISSALLGLGLNIGGVVNPQNAIDNDINTASTLNAGIGALGAYAQQTVVFEHQSIIGDSVRITVSLPKALLDVGLLTNTLISTFNGNTDNNDAQQLNGSLLRLRLLDLTADRQRLTVTYAPTKVFDRVQLRLGGIASVLSTLNFYGAELVIPKPVIKINNIAVDTVQACAGSTVALSATVSSPATINWYTTATGGIAVATGATFTTPALNANTIYYVSATRAGCPTASDRAPIVIRVNPIPAAPIITNFNIPVCPNSSAVFVAAPVAGVTVKWYSAATGGTLLFSGNTFTTPVLTATTSYYAEATTGSGVCASTTRTQVTATLSPVPAAPALVNATPSICDGDVAVLAVTPVAGLSYNWYNTATGGTPLFTGANFTTAALNANITYYVEAANGASCVSATRTAANITVQAKPANPVVSAIGLTVAAGQTATLNITSPQPGISYNWYTSATATTPIATGISFVTPALFSTTTYYVSAATSSGCQSPARTQVTVSVTINNNSPCTFANQQTHVVNGVCLLCDVTTPELAADADTTTASTIVVPVGLLGGSASQTLQFQQPGFAGDTIRLVLQSPGGLADLSLLGGINVAVFNGTTPVANYPLNSSLLTLRLLGGTGRYAAYIPAVGNYDRIVVTLNSGAATLLTKLQVYYAVQQYPKPKFNPVAPEICKGSSATLTITTPNPANGTFNWFTTATGGASVHTGASFPTPALNANTTYYVEYSRGGTCVSPVRTPVQVIVNDIPVKPVVTPSSANILAGQTATLKATAVNNATINWYTSPTGGTPVFTGATFTTPVLNTNTTYYAEASLGSCVSPDRTAVPVTVTPVVIPDITVSPATQSVNTGTTATITASSTTGGTVFNWYTTATGGTPIFTGPTFVSPSIFASTTYYAEAVVTATGVKSAIRAPATVNVNGVGNNPVACDAAIDQTNDASGICLLCGTTNPGGAVDNNRNSFSQIHVPVGLLGGSAQQTLRFANAGIVGDSVVVELGIPGSLADVGLLSQIQLATYNGNTYNGDRFTVNGSLLTLTLLDGTNRFRVAFKAAHAFDRVQVTFNSGVAGLLNTVNVYDATVNVASPTITVPNVSACPGAPVTLSATVPANVIVKWYSTPTGGNVLFTGPNFATPAVIGTTVYYAEATRAGTGCVQAVRTPVTVTISPVPSAPVVTNINIPVCPGSTVTFTAQAATGITINWYATATGGTPLFTGASFTTPALTATTSYYAEAVAGGTCISATRTPVTATLSALPTVPTLALPNNPSICDGDVAVLAIANPVPGQTYNWYSTAAGGTSLFTGTNFTSPVLHANTTYYAEAVNAAGCASGTRVAANVTVTPKPANPVVVANNSTVVAGQTATINVTNAQTGITYNWYTSATGPTPVFTGNPFTTPALLNTTTYYVEAANGTGCKSAARTAVTINVTINNNSPCTFANQQTNGANGLCVLCTVNNAPLAVDADTTTASTIVVPVGLVGGTNSQTLQFQQPGFAGDVIKLVFQTPVSLADVSLLGSISVGVYNGTTLVATYPLNSSLLTLKLLSTGNRYAVLVPATGNYDRVRISLNGGLATLLTSLNVFYAIQQYPTPVFNPVAPEICKGTSATINITTPNPANGTFSWFTTPTGGIAVATGASFPTPVLNANTTYYVEYSRGGTCVSSVRNAIQVIVDDAPVKPVVTPPNSNIFAGQTTTFKATIVNNATIKWYNQPTGGSPIFTGDTFTTPALTTNTTYYAEASLGSCVSPDRTVVPVIVTPVVIPDVSVTPANQAINAGTTATLTASSLTPGTTFTWYTAQTGGTPIFTGPTFVTPALFAAATYYAEATVTATGVKSATRASGVVNVNGVGTEPVPCDAAIAQTNSANGVCLLCSVSNEAGAVDNNRNSFSQIHIPVGLLGASAQQTLRFANAGIIGDSVTVELGIPGSLLDLSVLSQIQIATYNGTAFNNDRFTVNGSLLTLTILNGTTRFKVPFKAAHAFDRVEITFNGGLATALSAVNVYDAYQSVTAPTITVPGVAVCQGLPGTLTVNNVPANVTIKWYTSATGGTAVFTGATFTTPAVTATTTYYAEASRTVSGCAQATRTPATVTITPAPTAPVVDALSKDVCAGQTKTFTATAATGVTFSWYAAATGGAPLFTGPTFTTPAITATTDFYVQATAGQCGSSTRTKVTARLIATPAVPVVPTIPEQICAGSPATLSVPIPIAGITYNWYTAATGGTLVHTGPQFTTPALTASTSYYVEAVSTGGCTSSTRAKADVSVNPTPAAPTIAVNPASRNITSGQTAAITASSSTTGAIYKWYAAATGGTPVFTGALFVTPPLTSTTTYYAEVSTVAGCASATRTAVTITVNPIFSTSCDFASSQTFDVNGGLICIGCAVNTPDNAVDSDTTNFSQLNVPIGLLGANVSQKLIFSDGGALGDTVTVKIRIPGSLISLALLNSLQIASYNGNTFNNDRTTLNSNLLKLTILAGGQTALVKFAPKSAFDRVELRLNGAVASVFNAVNIYYASKQVEAPTLTANGTVNICSGNPATFSVNNARAGVTYKWYTSATGSASVHTGPSFTTAALTGTTTYYVESSRASSGCANPNRVAATANVTPAPVNPVLARASVPVCSGSTGVFTVSPTQAGVVYNWYTAATGGTPIFTGAQFTTPVLTANTSYYVEASSTGCTSPARTRADAAVTPTPVAATVTVNPANGNIPTGGTATLTANSITAGAIYKWYTLATGGTAISTGAIFTTPALNATTTYYAEVSLASGCVAPQRTPVIITVTQPVIVPNVAVNPATQTVNAGTSGTLVASSTTPGATVFNWFTTPTGGQSIFTGANFITPPAFGQTVYYAESSIPATGVVSATRASGIVNVNPIGPNPVPCDAAIDQTNSVNGVCLLCGTTNEGGSVDNNRNTFSQIHIPVGLLGASAQQTLRFANTGIVGDSIIVELGTPGSLLDLTVLSQIQIATYNGTTYNGDRFSVNGSLLTLTVLNGTTRFRVPFKAAHTFDRVEITFNGGLATALSALNVYDAYQSVTAPVISGTSPTICEGLSATLTVAPVAPNVTIRWYTTATGGNPVFTGAVFPTPALNITTTYYAEASRTSSNCPQAVRTPVTVNVTPAPQAPVVAVLDQPVCSGQPATFTATAVTGVTFKWYNAATGGTPVFTGNPFVTAPLSASAIYYVEASSTASCGSSTRTRVTATITTTPLVPVVAVILPPTCSGTSATLSVSSPIPGITYNWYATATGGTPVLTGATVHTPILTASTSYYVEAAAGICTSTTRAKADVIVNPTPTAPIVVPNTPGGQITSGQKATLTVTPTTPGVTYNWYNTATGGAAIFTGPSFTTPALTSNTTYYVEAVATQGGCSSVTRTAVTVKVNPIFSTNCDFASTQTNDVNGVCVACGVTDENNSVDQDTTNFSQLHMPVSLLGSFVNQKLIFSDAGVVGDTVTLKISLPTSLADINVLNSIQLASYSGTTYNGDRITLSSNLLRVAILTGGKTAIVKFAPKAGFDRIEVRLNGGLVTLLTTLNVYYASKQVETPTLVTANPAPICAGGTASLTVSNVRAGVTYKWYTQAVGGTSVFTGPVFTPPNITATITYYVESSRATTGCANPNRVGATINVIPTPQNPLVENANRPICVGETAEFKIINIQPGVTYNWYTAQTGGTLAGTGPIFRISPAATTFYYIEAVNNGTSCTNPIRTLVTVKVNPTPANPGVASPNVPVCLGSTASLVVLSPEPGVTYKWYTTLTGGIAVATGPTFTTPAITTNVIYYIEATNDLTGCVNTGGRTAVNVSPDALPVAPALSAVQNPVCNGGTATINVINPVAGVTYNWYDAATAGTLVHTGKDFTTPNLTGTVSYYVEAVNNASPTATCSSTTRTKIEITVLPLPPTPIVLIPAGGNFACFGSPATLTITNGQAGFIYKWYTVATGGTPVATTSNPIFITPQPLTADITYYVEATSTGNCNSSTRTAVPVSVKPLPNAPVLQGGGDKVCLGNTTTLTVQTQAGVTYKWYKVLTGGAPVFTGNPYPTPPITATTDFYVEAINSNDCGNAGGRVKIEVTVTAPPAAPVIASNSASSTCSGTTAILIVDHSVLLTYRWYDLPTGGTLLASGFSYTTPVLTATKTYYVEAVTGGGCASSTRTAVPVTVDPLPGNPTVTAVGGKFAICSGSSATLTATATGAITFKWYTVATGGTPVFTGATFPTPPVTAAITYYVEAVSDKGCASNARIAVPLTVDNTKAPDPIVDPSSKSTCQNSTATLKIVNPIPGTLYTWYNASGAVVGTGPSFITTVLTGATDFYVDATNAQVCNPSTRVLVHVSVTPQPPAPTVDNANPSVCLGSDITLSVKNAQSGITYNWYDSPTRANLVNTGPSFVLHAVTADATYYVEAANGSCSSSALTKVDVKVSAAPAAPANPGNAGIDNCQGASIALNVVSPLPGLTYNWYTSQTGGTPVGTGLSYRTPVLTATTIYYLEAVNASNCPSASRTPYKVNVTGLPVAPQASTTGTSICPGKTTTISATSATPGATINWYADATGGAPLLTNSNTFTTPVLSAGATYYAEAVTPGNCVSTVRTPVAVTILTALPAPVATVGTTTNNSVTFIWVPVTGATGYQVSIDNGQHFTAPSSGAAGLTHVVNNLQPGQSVTFIVRASGDSDCQLSANSAAVTGTAGNPFGNGLFVPNVFTPNGDGNNDILFVYGNTIKTLTLSIYDQWGELQFKSTNKSSGWDGTYKGTKQPVGVYVYYVEATMNDGQVVKKKGTVTLLR